MQENEAEVLARIEATRVRMGDTIDQIGDRVNPDRVQAEIKARAREQVREVKANVKHKARSAMRDMEHEVSDAGRGLWDTIRDNPIPAGMVGVGLAWLVANGATSDHDDLDYRYRPRYGAARPMGPYDEVEYGYGYDVRGRPTRPAMAGAAYSYSGERDSSERDLTDEARERMGDMADEAKGRASEAKDRVSAKAHEAADEARDRASELKDRASGRMEEMQHRAGHRIDEMQHRAGSAVRHAGRRARRAERRVEHAVQDNPLAAGAIAAALGFAAGMMIPETRREHEMFGPARDRMIENAEKTVRSAGKKARDVAKDTASETARRAVDEVTGGSDRERASVSEPGR